MKKLLICLFFLQGLFAMDQEEIDNKFKKLEQIRTSINKDDISTIEDPFYRPKSSIEESQFNLQAIVGKTAKINNKWYTVGSEVFTGYKLVYIAKDKAVISDSGYYLELKIKGSEDVKIK